MGINLPRRRRPADDHEPVQRGDRGEARLWRLGTVLTVSFTVAVVGLAGLAWLAWVLLGVAGYRHHGAPALKDTIGVLQLVFATVAGAGALVALIVAYRRQKITEADSAHDRTRVFNERFRQLLAMPVPQPADMCPECQAPADWHTYAVSLRLFQPKPEPGSQAETIARLMPGWWERCPASTSIQIRQQWGQGLLGFDGAQWRAMLTPLLRAIFAPAPPPQREKPDQRAVLERRLRSAEAEARRIRRELGRLGPDTDEGRRQ